MNILFVCKYNRFRSRVAEAYFNKTNKNKHIKAMSAGVIRGDYPLDRTEVDAAKKSGINISGNPRALSMDIMRKTDFIVIVADNVPKHVFYTTFKKRIVVWRIKDIEHWDGKDLIKRKIKIIMNKVEKLIQKFESKSFRKKIQLQKEKAEYEHRNSKRL